MQGSGINYKAWFILIVLIAALAVTFRWNSPMAPSDPHGHEPEQQAPVEKPKPRVPKATLEPGRVVSLETNRGIIDFVLFEKDCPQTTKLISGLVQDGKYDNIKFSRVDEGALIRTESLTKGLKSIKKEVLEGLLHEKGAVGLAQWKSTEDEAGAIYICLEPLHHLDYEYVVFGRVIDGIDIAGSIVLNDVIKKASIRPLTGADRQRLNQVMTIEVERRAN